MCVIAICEFGRLTDDQVSQMYDANPKGGGVAWRDWSEETGEIVVKWKKGLDKGQMMEMNKDLPLPYVLHFRVPSSGTSQSWFACHPFQIDEDATTGFEGETSGFVLFHNGFWNDWRKKIQDIAISGFVKLPTGPWSDSRALALAAHHLGLGILEMVDEKVVAFGPEEDDIEVFGGWMSTKGIGPEGDEKSILVSNKTWERTVHAGGHQGHGRGQSCGVPNQPSITALAQAAITPGGGAGNQGSFRRQDEGAAGQAGSQGDNAQSIQEGVQSASAGGGGGVSGSNESGNHSLGPTLIKCSGCPKRTAKGEHLNDKFYCFQCWAERAQPKKRRVGRCWTCKVEMAATRRYDDDNWICVACWESTGKPKVYFIGGQIDDQAE
jgi:hypothetical protein